jgi:hypothetical protein
MDYQDFAYLALKAGKPINVAYVPRADYRGIQAYRDSVNKDVEQGRLSPKAIYITSGTALDGFSNPVKMGTAVLHSLDNCFFLLSSEIKNPVLDTLTKRLDAKYRDRLDSVMMVCGRKNEFTPVPGTLHARPGTIHYNLELASFSPYFVSIHAWAVRDSTRDNTHDSTFFTLDAGDRSYSALPVLTDRPDVAAAFPGAHITNAGINLVAFTDSMPKGTYQLGITVKTYGGQYIHQSVGRMVKVGVDYAARVKLTALPPESKILNDINIDEQSRDFSADGWAALPDRDATRSTIQLILKSKDVTFAYDVRPAVRKDVTEAFQHKYNLDNSGFHVKIDKKSLPPGAYRIGFIINDAAHHEAYMMLTDHAIGN